MPSSTPVAKPTKTKRLLLEYTPTVNVEDQVVANENANETVDGIMQELLSMNYEFDPFRCEQEETRVVTNEPEETLVEGETVLDGEEDSGTEEDESDDEDYLFDEDTTYLGRKSVQEPEYDVNPDDLDVIDTDNFESGTDSDDDGIEKVRRKKLKQIKKAKESEDNIVHKHFFFVGQTFASADVVKERVRLHSIETRRQLYLAKNDKVRIRAKCFGRNPVFILDGEGPSTTDVGPKKKTIKGKVNMMITPLGPKRKGISSGGRSKEPIMKNIMLSVKENYCFTLQVLVKKGIVDQVEKNLDIPIRALQEELQRKYELGVSRQKAFRAKAAALNQVKGTRGPLKKGFKACGSGRDLLGLDGAFMKGPIQSMVAEHRSCLRHIHENMKKQWNGQAYKELLWRCASVTTVPYFDKAMQDLKDFNKETLMILDARDAPIITALEYIREYLMRRMVNVIAVIKKTDGPLTPSATKSCKGQKDPYTGTSQTTPSTAPAKKPSDAGTRKRPSDAHMANLYSLIPQRTCKDESGTKETNSSSPLLSGARVPT
ncbi:hypothetical protein Tco_0265682 [Tanacetum coccineum]